MLSACPLHTNNSECGKREANIIWSIVTCKGSTRYWNYLEDYWPSAGGVLAVISIGTQLRDPINSGPTRWRMGQYIIKWTPPRKLGEIPRVSTRFSLSVENEQVNAGRDGTAELVSRDQILRRETGTGKYIFSCSAHHEQDWQPYSIDLYSAICNAHIVGE